MTMLVGREQPIGILRGEVERALTSHGGLVLVTGEAGIGKSALVAQAVGIAVGAGALVLSGACWEGEGAPGYWPWIQVVRGLGQQGLPADSSDFELYDAVTTMLVTASRERPVLVVLEDLHWADPASIKLLEFVVKHAWFERLMVVGTYRDAEVSSTGHPLELLQAQATTLTLTGLGRDEVARLIADTTGAEPGDDLVTEIHRRTGGNPFFVEQTARLWQGGSPLATIPPGVRAALRRRLSRLPDDATDLLASAAVLGREFDSRVLAGPGVDQLLDQAVAARLVSALGAGRFAFVHDLVRETLYADLDETDRRGRHEVALRALDGGSATERAAHAYLARSADAADLLLAAARDAELRLSAEEAVGHYGRALELVTEPRKHAEVMLELGIAQHHAGDLTASRRTLDQAIEDVRAIDEPELLAHAALRLHNLGGVQPWIDFVHEAHTRLVLDGSADKDQAGQELTQYAADQARAAGNDRELGYSLQSRIGAIWGPGTAEERAAIAAELAAVAHRLHDLDLELNAASWLSSAFLELSDPRYVEHHHAFVAKAEHAGLSLFTHEAAVRKTLFATLTGQFDEARRFAAETLEAGEQPHVDKWGLNWLQRWSIELIQGRFAEADAVLVEMRDAGSQIYPLLNAVTSVQRGERRSAVLHLTEVMATGEEAMHWMRPLWLRFQAQAAALSRDPALCESARAALLPYRGQWALTSTFIAEGPFDHWIAVLDAAQERWDEAIVGFTAAQAEADRLGARPWSIEARARLAEVLIAGGRDATALVKEVEREAAELGMLVRLPQPDANTFRLADGVWTLTFAGQTVHLPDSKGLRDLHLLIGSPGADVSAVQLLNPAGGEVVIAARSMGGDAVLDDAAKDAYRRRLDLLDEEIDRAAERGDDHQAAELDREREALLDELRTASGLGGRSRRLGDEAERARKAVTNRIRDTLRRVEQRHPELGAHLRASVSTGVTCRYQPQGDPDWTL